jgi:DNA replication protein DnaC
VVSSDSEPPQDLEAQFYRKALAGIPKHFREHRFSTVAPYLKRPAAIEEADAALEGILAGQVLAVTLVGQSETGKTSLAAAMLAALVEEAVLTGARGARRLVRGSLWTDALALSRARASAKLGDGEAPLVARAIGAELLIVDELGSETVAGSDELIDVIFRRWQDERPTIVTTGQPRDRIVQRYGNGIHTRLMKQAQSRLIFCAPQKERPADRQLSLEVPPR